MNPRYGARPVNNLFAKFIKKLVSEIVLENELRRVQSAGAKPSDGGEIAITFDRANDEFTAVFKAKNAGFLASAPPPKKAKIDTLDLNDAR